MKMHECISNLLCYHESILQDRSHQEGNVYAVPCTGWRQELAAMSSKTTDWRAYVEHTPINLLLGSCEAVHKYSKGAPASVPTSTGVFISV